METINNVATAASRAIWGDSTQTTEQSGTEPVSGEKGDTSAGEPYDAGNKEESTETSTTVPESNTTTTDTAASGITTTGTQQTDLPIRTEKETDKTGVTSVTDPSFAVSDTKPSSANAALDSGPTPSTGTDPAIAAQSTQKEQGVDRPLDEPKEPVGSGATTTSEETTKESGVSGAGTSGGDFDTSKTGTGNVEDFAHNDLPAKSTLEESTSTGPEHKEKRSLKEKIKAKLHKS